MRIYIAMTLTKSVGIEVLGNAVDIPMDYADGMVGALPAFESREAATAYFGEDDAHILVMEVDDE